MCAILHHGQSQQIYEEAFEVAVKACSLKPPTVLMTDDSDAERNALRKVFPKATLLLCIFHRTQATWRWLCDANHRIPKDQRQELIKSYCQMLYSESPERAEECMVEIREYFNESYPQYIRYWNNNGNKDMNG